MLYSQSHKIIQEKCSIHTKLLANPNINQTTKSTQIPLLVQTQSFYNPTLSKYLEKLVINAMFILRLYKKLELKVNNLKFFSG